MKEILRRLFDYKNGQLIWKLKGVRGFNQTGMPAGTENKGYVWVSTKFIEGRRKVYGLQRLIWMWHNGDITHGVFIDHIDRNPLNNRIENLRPATPSQNSMNASGKSNKKSGLPKNVYVDFIYKDVIKYRAQVFVKGVSYREGGFDTPDLAALSAITLREKYHKEFAI